MTMRVLTIFLAFLASISAVSAAELEGPLGNPATPVSGIALSDSERQTIRQGGYKAALVWHGSSTWVNALTAGAKAAFDELGIRLVGQTDAQFDPAKQASDLENVMALEPDMILTLVIDGASVKSSFDKAVKAGAELVLLSNPISGYQPGREYVGIVTDDMQGMGVAAAELMAEAVPGGGNIGVIYHDADYFITNTRDRAFMNAIDSGEHGAFSVKAKRGFTKESETSSIASAMVLQYPMLEAVYVSWDAAAEGVIAGLRAAGRPDIKVITHDLGVNNLVDMAMGGNLYASVADRPYEIGYAMALLGAYGILDKPAPAFSVVGFDKVRRDSIAQVWQSTYHTPLPPLLQRALQQ